MPASSYGSWSLQPVEPGSFRKVILTPVLEAVASTRFDIASGPLRMVREWNEGPDAIISTEIIPAVLARSATLMAFTRKRDP
jgi:hypothetical protein